MIKNGIIYINAQVLSGANKLKLVENNKCYSTGFQYGHLLYCVSQLLITANSGPFGEVTIDQFSPAPPHLPSVWAAAFISDEPKHLSVYAITLQARAVVSNKYECSR